MAKLTTKQIHVIALKLLEDAPEGVQWSSWLGAIHLQGPETPMNTIQGAVSGLKNNPDVVKIARGTYQFARYQDDQSKPTYDQNKNTIDEPVQAAPSPINKAIFVESDFYDSFASWLINSAEDVSVAVALGGSALKGKWGTPDVLGVLKPGPKDILKFQMQIVSAEIKIDPNQPVVAFGQAVAYRLFSHKAYIVVPNVTSADDFDRLKALCSIHGLGLVTFALDPANPEYRAVVLPQQATPDMFYANQMVHRLFDASYTMAEKLFS